MRLKKQQCDYIYMGMGNSRVVDTVIPLKMFLNVIYLRDLTNSSNATVAWTSEQNRSQELKLDLSCHWPEPNPLNITDSRRVHQQ